MKNKLVFLVLLLPAILFTGCYDHKEIDETAYIVALGIDSGADGNFSYTFQFSSPLAIMGESEGGENSKNSSAGDKEGSEGGNSTVNNLTISAPDFYIAKNMTNNFLSKNVDMSHLKLIVFSAQLNADDLESHSQLLLREREVRPHTAIAVAADSAAKYLENVNPELESNTSKYYELMSLRSNNVYAPTKRLHDFVDEITTKTCDTVLPIAVSGKELEKFPQGTGTSGWVSTLNSKISSGHSVLYGMEIFKDGKPTSALNGDDAMIFNILNRNIKDCTVTLQDKYSPEKTVTFRLIIPENASYAVDIPDKTVTVTQDFRAEFLGGILPQGYSSFDELNAYAREILTQRITDFFTTVSRTEAADIMNIRSCLRKSFLTWEEWNTFDWDSFYTSAEFAVNIKFS